jgi:hypothetical protein
LTGDPLSKVWIPYLGVRGKGRCCKELVYKWRLVGSPFASNRFRDPILFHCQSPAQTEIHQSVFSLQTSNGRYLYGEFEGLYQVSPTMYFNGWLRGSWQKYTGEGESNLTVIGSTVIGNTINIPIQPGSLPIDHATFETSWWGLGVSLDLQF